jgi:hypothetical protein
LTTGVSALAAGISAVWNLGMEIVSQKVSEELDELNGTVEEVEEATFTESEVE